MTILAPMFAMVVLTLSVLPCGYLARRRAVASGRISRESLKLFDASVMPEEVIKTTRHLANLFEVPVLFYVACLTAYVLQMDKTSLVVLGWTYVIFRAAHSLIHLTYNDVVHRTRAFMLSNFVLYVLWFLIILGSVGR